MKQTIDSYRLTSMEEPSEEILSQLMKEAAEEARLSNEEITQCFFKQMCKEASQIVAQW